MTFTNPLLPPCCCSLIPGAMSLLNCSQSLWQLSCSFYISQEQRKIFKVRRFVRGNRQIAIGPQEATSGEPATHWRLLLSKPWSHSLQAVKICLMLTILCMKPWLVIPPPKKKGGILIMILLHLIRMLRVEKIVMFPFPRRDASQSSKLKTNYRRSNSAAQTGWKQLHRYTTEWIISFRLDFRS